MPLRASRFELGTKQATVARLGPANATNESEFEFEAVEYDETSLADLGLVGAESERVAGQIDRNSLTLLGSHSAISRT